MLKVISGTLFFIQIFILHACGQSHQENQSWLEKVKETESSTVVLNNQDDVIPIKNLEHLKIASVNLGFGEYAVLDSMFNKYKHTAQVSYLKDTENGLGVLQDDLKFFNTVIIALSDSSLKDTAIIKFIRNLSPKKKVILALFGDGKSLRNLDQIPHPVIWSSEQTPVAAHTVAQIIFGGLGSQAKLKQDFSEKYKSGSGDETFPFRLAYTVPEELGLNVNDFAEIDKIAAEAISEKATPGAVVLVAKNGKVIFNKAYGYHTYENIEPTKVTDIFDLASITKIAATTVDVMKLYEDQQLDLEKSLSNYIFSTKKTNKANVKVKDVLLHQAGFVPFIPFYNDLKPADFSRDSSASFSTKVADSFYISKDYYKKVMLDRMIKSGLKTPGKYEYSDLSMYFMKEIVEGISEETMPNFTQTNFYDKLGMHTTTFNPRNKFDKNRIVPTEQDSYFRKTLLWGYVHDQGAAMAGGVAGHAGLFSNGTDLATLFQMLLNKGSYGGVEYFKPETVDFFTRKQSDVSRRGLGFDRWDPDLTKKYPSQFASPETYGHTGYTGTCVWVDPTENLIYIFLSNRVHPKVTNKLSTMNIRPRIQDVIYKAIKNSKQ
jgi:CubicO group peptidase (beta-lactamase class C family)